MKALNIFLLLIFSFYIFSSLFLQTIHPPVWPDEAIYAEVVENVIATGTIKSDLWKDAIINIQTKAMWNPPLFFYEYALWQRVWGESIYYQRALVQIVGFAALVILFLLLKKKHLAGHVLLPLALWVSNVVVAKSTRLARPEIFVLMFGLLGLYLMSRAHEDNKKNNYLLFGLAGLAFGMSILNHIIGIIFIIGTLASIIFQEKNNLLRKYSVVLLTCLVTLLPWLIDVYLHWNTFLQQFNLSSYPRSLVASWLHVDLLTGELLQRVVLASYLILSLYIVTLLLQKIFLLKKKVLAIQALSVSMLAIAWILSVKGKSEFYSIYPITLTILATYYFISDASFSTHRKRLLQLSACILIAQIIQTISLINGAAQGGYKYEAFANAVASKIPEESSVFLTAIPDPYYGLTSKKGITLYEFPAVPIARDKYLNILNDSDYVVYNGHFEAHLFGNFITTYIQKNLESKSEVHAGGYDAFVFKLIDKTKRITDF
ncbi:glycosyltransferase family 39 protein [Candidatus Woesebacteria bacterium]|nr:glycosyltransferase family 39 protein [Candidatus Woesebacteria bacterium]